MLSRNFRYGRLPVWIASLALLALTACGMAPGSQTADETADAELAADSQLPPDDTESPGRREPPTDETADAESTDDTGLIREERPSDDGRDRLGDVIRDTTRGEADPPADESPSPQPPTSGGDECLSPDDSCCQNAMALVRRLERRGARITDEGRGASIRSIVEESPACFVGFDFADD